MLWLGVSIEKVSGCQLNASVKRSASVTVKQSVSIMESDTVISLGVCVNSIVISTTCVRANANVRVNSHVTVFVTISGGQCQHRQCEHQHRPLSASTSTSLFRCPREQHNSREVPSNSSVGSTTFQQIASPPFLTRRVDSTTRNPRSPQVCLNSRVRFFFVWASSRLGLETAKILFTA